MNENEEGKGIEVIEPVPEEKKEEVKEQEKQEAKEEVKEEKKTEEKKVEQKELVKKEKENNNEVTDKENKKFKWILFASVFFLIVLMMSIIFSLINIGNTKIMKGIFIKDIDVSDMTIEEAKQKLEEIKKIELEKTIELKYKDLEVVISPEQIEADYDTDKAVQEAYKIGRKGNIVENNYDIFYALVFKKHIEPQFIYSEEKLDALIDDISKKLPDSVVEGEYSIQDDYLVITKGHYGTTIKKEITKQSIINCIKGKENKLIELEVEYKEPDKLEVDDIYSKVYTEPKDAYYETNPFKIYPHVNGIDFAITLDEAREILEKEEQEYKIPLKFTEPAITTSKIGTEAFPDLLASFSTKYDASNVNRSTNMELAAQKINELVLMPGEVFSFNKVVGKRTPEAGYKLAGVYEAGRVTTGYGGGICQVSSTLYNVAVLSNLEILERKNHQFLTGYVSASRDATVNYGTIDFQFRNSRKYPIKIMCSVSNGICEVKLYGAKEEVEYIVQIESKVLGSIPYTTKYEEDPNLDIGKEVIDQSGANGCRSVAYKILILNGSVVSQDVLSEDTYSAMTKIIRKGTRGTAVVKTEPEEPANNPEPETPASE